MRYFFNGMIILSLACASEDGLKVYNADPSISIQSHGMDAEIQEALPTMFWAQASDGNHSFDELVCSWYVYDAAGNELSSCDWAAPDDEGISSCELTFGSEASRVSVNVKDPLDAADADEITIQIVSNEPPSIEILKPTASEYYYADAAVPFHAQVSDAEDSPEDLLLEWSSSLDGVLELGAVADSAGLSQSSTALTAGEHEIRLEVTDSAENTVSEIVTIAVYEANEPPSCEIVTPQDGESFASGDPILFSATATDPNVSSDQLVVEWYSDKDAPLADGVALGSSVPSSSDGSISFAATALSVNVHTITMLVTDEQGSTCTDSVLVAVAEPGQAPQIDDLDIDPDPIYNDSTLICSASVTDPDSSYLSSYSWTNTTQATSIGSNDPYIAMQPSLGMPGDVISCELEVSDSIGSDVSVAYKTIENRAPTTSAAVSPTTASVTALLTCTSSSSDPDEEAVTETYTWTNTTTGQTLGTGSSLQLSSSMASSGDTIVCTVEATDESGETATATASTDILQPPFINTIEIDPTPLYNDSNLTCTATVYDPTGNATLTYSWEIDGVSAGTGSLLSLSSTIADPQDAVRCSAFVTDGLNSDQLDVDEVVENRDPVVGTVSITPAAPEEDDDVECNASASDPDGETPSLTYSWSLNGTDVGTGSSLELSTTGAIAGDSLVCTATSEDSYGGTDSNFAVTTIVEAGPNPQAICTVDPLVTTPPFGIVTFDGSGSNDDGTIVSYEWTLLSFPTGSAETLGTPNAAITELVTDLAGMYTAELVVTDNDGLTGSCQVSVEAIPEEDLRIEMFWTESGDDMDLHLLPPGYWAQHGCNIYTSGSLKSDICYFSNCRANATTGLNSVDWGDTRNSSSNTGYEDDPYLDLDDVSGVGPENINIETPENTSDEYVVVVHDYAGSNDPTTSNDVTVNVYVDGLLVDSDTRGITGEDSYSAFFSIDYSTGTVTPMTDTCSGGSSNSSGCDDTCIHANDGYCEDITSSNNDYGWDWCASGTDCTDCSTASSSTGCDDSCTWANDGYCDDDSSPNFDGADVCSDGTDCTDCSN